MGYDSVMGRCAAVLVLLCLCSHSATGQLQVRLPINFATFAQGSKFSTTPLPVAGNDYCAVIGASPKGAVQCGEVDTRTGYSFQNGGMYRASVSATSFRAGATSISWAPYVACVRLLGSGESIAGGNSAACSQTFAAGDRGMFWDLGGSVSIPDRTPAGKYISKVTITVTGPRLLAAVTVNATMVVAAAPVKCTVTSGGSIAFGEAKAGTAGSVTLNPVTGRRTYAGGQSGSRTHTFATVEVATNARAVVASVSAPTDLGSSVSFTSLLASRLLPFGAWKQVLSGTGSTSRLVGADGQIAYRIGGRVAIKASSTVRSYSGIVRTSFICN